MVEDAELETDSAFELLLLGRCRVRDYCNFTQKREGRCPLGPVFLRICVLVTRWDDEGVSDGFGVDCANKKLQYRSVKWAAFE